MHWGSSRLLGTSDVPFQQCGLPWFISRETRYALGAALHNPAPSGMRAMEDVERQVDPQAYVRDLSS